MTHFNFFLFSYFSLMVICSPTTNSTCQSILTSQEYTSNCMKVAGNSDFGRDCYSWWCWWSLILFGLYIVGFVGNLDGFVDDQQIWYLWSNCMKVTGNNDLIMVIGMLDRWSRNVFFLCLVHVKFYTWWLIEVCRMSPTALLVWFDETVDETWWYHLTCVF